MEDKQKPPSGEETGGLKLCELGQEVVIPAGSRVVSQGETPEFFYVIQAGRLRVFRETADRIQTNLTELGPGAYFGEVALVTGQPRSASVETLTEARLIKVSQAEFDRLLDQNPKLARHIINQLANWLVTGDSRLEKEVVHQVKLRQISWFDYALMITVLIERGKIVAVGAEVEIPYDASVFNVGGKVVFPGMIDVHTGRGLDIPNEPRPVTPQLDAADALDPSQLFFEDCLRLGITAVHVIPANNTIIGGLGRVVRPIGLTVAEMTITDGEFLKLAITPRAGFDRMYQLATLRETFLELDDYLARVAEKRYEDKLKEEDKKIDVGLAEARKRGRELIRAEDIDDQHRNVLRLRGGQVRVAGETGPTLFPPLGTFVYCGDAMDVGLAVQLAKDNGFFERTVLVLGGECYKAASELKKAARPVVLPQELTYRETNPLTGEVRETFVPKKIYEAGLLFALVPGPDESYAERMLPYQAAKCVRNGIPRDEALRAITLNPAKILRLDKRLGSLEPGKDACLVIFSGDPLEFTSVVEQVFIDGIPAYDRAKDVRLQKLLSPGTSDSREKPE